MLRSAPPPSPMPSSPHILVATSDAQIEADLLEAVLHAVEEGGSLRSTPLDELDAQLLRRHVADVLVCDLRATDSATQQRCMVALASLPMRAVLVLSEANDAVRRLLARRSHVTLLCEPLPRGGISQALSAVLCPLTDVRSLRPAPEAFSGMVGESPAMTAVHDAIAGAARSCGGVLVIGESGTGKELAARALHALSERQREPFVGVNCAAIPESLLESELFGHVRGAFTDARHERAGLFVQAGAGTLFLDEIGDMAPAMQARLLRALQERRVRPVGSDQEVAFEARVIAATHHDLHAEGQAGRFRRDLFFRLAVFEIVLPPLRERGADVLRIAEGFLKRTAAARRRAPLAISAEAAERLLAYPWPGNVRELQNCLERAMAYSTTRNEVRAEDLPERVRDPKGGAGRSAEGPAPLASLAEVERKHIEHVLESVGGNYQHAARVLEVDRSTLYRKLARYRKEGA